MTQPVVSPPPWWARKTFWTSTAGLATAIGAAAGAVYGAQHWTTLLALAIAAFLANLGSIFAESAGTKAAEKVADAAGVPVVKP